MKIQLYLKDINQDMLDAGLAARLGSAAGWEGCCIAIASIGSPGAAIRPAKRSFILRKEKEGGMFWDPQTRAVYKVDEQAYHVMCDLDQGFPEQEAARRNKVSLKAVKALTSQLAQIRK